MNLYDIKKELLYFYTYSTLSELSDISQSTLENLDTNQVSDETEYKLKKFFNKHCEAFSKEVVLPEITDTNKRYMVNTPDGFQLIKQFITKPQKPCVRIETASGCIIECAEEHLIQVNLNSNKEEDWKLACQFKIGDTVETINGVDTVTQVTSISTQDVYDFEVDHNNHRYWSGGFSNHNTGKSLFVQKILANAQQKGLYAVIFDTENSIDPDGAKRLGLDIEKVKYVPCVTIEQTRNAVYTFLNSVKEKKLEGKFIVAIDSLGNLQSELELTRMSKDSTSADMGTKARAMKSLLQTCTNLGAVTQTTFICTNHVYDNPAELFPSIEKNCPGGKSTVFLPSVTVQLARKPIKGDDGKTMDGKLAVAQKNYPGVIIRALTRKNRFIKQYLEGEMYLSFATGLDKYYGLIDLAVGLNVVQQNGATYTLEDGTKLGYFKNFRKNKELWENTIVPKIAERIAVEWSYSNEESIPDEIQDIDETQE